LPDLTEGPSLLERYLHVFRCPQCGSALLAVNRSLTCAGCAASYKADSVIRFVATESYTESFGLQWRMFSRVQLDTPELRDSERRLRQETGLESSAIQGKIVLEVGCGMGRFLDVVTREGAGLAVGLDLSRAVDAAATNVGTRPNCLIVQGDLFRPPFAPGSFDVVYSIGVLHHTPSARNAFKALVPLVKPGGGVAISVYERSIGRGPLWEINMLRRRAFRLVTKRLPRRLLLWWSRFAVPVFWLIDRIPVLRYVRYAFPVVIYKRFPLSWSQLDTFDCYATTLESRHTAKEVFGWFRELGLRDIDLLPSDDGWVSICARVPGP
jgi:SAM-dependent methyltransferase